MIKRAVVVMAAAACLTSFAIGVNAQTDKPVQFKVENAADVTLTALYVSTPSSLDIDSDMLGHGVLRSGETAAVSVNGGTCAHDVRAEFSDGEEVEMKGVDLCRLKGSSLTVGG